MITPYPLVYMFLRWVLPPQEMLASLALVIYALLMLYILAQTAKAVESLDTRQVLWTIVVPVALVVAAAVLIISVLALITPAIRARVDQPAPTGSGPAAALPTLEPGFLKALPEEISLDALSEGIANQLEIQECTEKGDAIGH